jgi:outer membrane protein assembly factor BamB
MKRLLILTTALLALAPSMAKAEEWTQYGYDAAYTRVNVEQAPIDASRWRLRWSKAKNVETNPVILEDRIIVGGSKGSPTGQRTYLWCFDLEGNKLWTRNVGIGWPSESIAYIDGMVAIGVANLRDTELANATPELEFVDVQTGNKVISIPGVLGGHAPVADSEYVYQTPWMLTGLPMRLDPAHLDEVIVPAPGIGVSDRVLRKPPTIIGDEVWSMPPNDGNAPILGGGVALMSEGVASSTNIDTGAVTRTLSCDTVPDRGGCAIDVATGVTLWSYTRSETTITPTIVGDVAFMSCGFAHSICRRDLRTGLVLSQTPDFTHGIAPREWEATDGDRIWHGAGAPAVGGGVYFVNGWDVSLQKWVTAGIDVENGELLTRRRGLFGPTGGWHAAVANGLLVTTVPGLRVVSFDR